MIPTSLSTGSFNSCCRRRDSSERSRWSRRCDLPAFQVGTSLSLLDARFQLLSQRVHEPLVELRILASSASVKLDPPFGHARPASLGLTVFQNRRFFGRESR